MVCLGFEPGTAGLKAQINPLSYGGTRKSGILFSSQPWTIKIIRMLNFLSFQVRVSVIRLVNVWSLWQILKVVSNFRVHYVLSEFFIIIYKCTLGKLVFRSKALVVKVVPTLNAWWDRFIHWTKSQTILWQNIF